MMKLFALLVGSLVFGIPLLNANVCKKKNNGTLRRLGDTQYFIVHGIQRNGFVTQDEARKECASHGLKLAKVQNMISLAMLSRELEKLGFKDRLRDTWYWLDGIYDEKTEMYYWEAVKPDNVVTYSNFLYRPYRPTGTGKHVDFRGRYQPKRDLRQCLTLALPWPWPNNKTSETIYGHQAIFDEKYCLSKTSRHSLCEATGLDCDGRSKYSPLLFNDKKGSATFQYFEEGTWLFGSRKYIVNWEQRQFKDSKEYCASLGLQILTPGMDEKFLIPHIKIWSRTITNAQFWTNLMFDATTKRFLDHNGNDVTNNLPAVNWTRPDTFQGRRSKTIDKLYCVALSLSYEFKDQQPCYDWSNPKCSWSFIKYVPANCNNFHGSICQHSDHQKRTIGWEKTDPHNLANILEKFALTSFGYESNKRVLRSKYRQTFGSCYCPSGYSMQREMNTVQNQPDLRWTHIPARTNKHEIYSYDLEETYWLVDSTYKFDKKIGSDCTISYVDPKDKKSRKTKRVPCTEWHHYLCLRNAVPRMRKTDEDYNPAPPVTMEWRAGPQPRFYPILLPKDYVNDNKSQYHAVLDESSRPLRSISVIAQVVPNAKWIVLDLKNAKGSTPMHMSIRFSIGQVIFNTNEGGWGKEVKPASFPFRKGVTFQLDIRCGNETFDFYLDEKHFGNFKYRLPVNEIESVEISGGINVIEVIRNVQFTWF